MVKIIQSFKSTPQLAQQVERHSKKAGLTKTDFINEALEEKIKRLEQEDIQDSINTSVGDDIYKLLQMTNDILVLTKENNSMNKLTERVFHVLTQHIDSMQVVDDIIEDLKSENVILDMIREDIGLPKKREIK